MVIHNWFRNWKRVWKIKSQLINDISYYKKEVKEWHRLVEQYEKAHRDLSSKNTKLYKLICEKIETLFKAGGIK